MVRAEPKQTASRTASELPKRVMPSTLSALLQRAKDRRLNALPRCTRSSNETEEPKRASPKTASPLP